MSLKRRSFMAAGLGLGGLLAYSAHRGVRIPPLLFEPRPLTNQFDLQGVIITGEGLIQTTTTPASKPVAKALRAYVPEPSLQLGSLEHHRICIAVNNISPYAQLQLEEAVGAEVHEEIIGITRQLTITLARGSALRCHWSLPVAAGYTFAAIGDSGGQQELQWCIHRAHELGALFLLHLGDFDYAPGDYPRSINAFNTAPLPCYVSIGNHDFHDGDTVYQQFLDEIGPFNSNFELGGVRFINVDTASNILPYGGGQRGQMLQQLASEPAPTANIAFTHRPLFDPIEDSTHDIGNQGERDWLINALKACGAYTLLSGHIHIHARDTIQGIDNIIVGQGLGHQDLITNTDYSKMALGTVSAKGDVNFDFPSLGMPWEMHCHPRSDYVKESLFESEHFKRIQALESICSRQE